MGAVDYFITDDSLELKKEDHVFGKLINCSGLISKTARLAFVEKSGSN